MYFTGILLIFLLLVVIWDTLTKFSFRELTTNLAPGLHQVNADLLN